MGIGKTWSDEENKLLVAMIAEGPTFQQAFDSMKFPDRTLDSVRGQFQRLSASSPTNVERFTIVRAIEPSIDTLTMEKAVKLFSSAFEQICAAERIDKQMLERFRIIFQAAKDYVPLLAGYEKWDKIEKKIEELSAKLEEIQAMKGVAKT